MPEPKSTGETEKNHDNLVSEDKATDQKTTSKANVADAPKAPETTETITPKPKKKSKGWLIGVIIASILFLAICGVAIWYFAFYSNPNKVAYDAINKIISAENVSIDGGIVAASDDFMVIVNLDSTASHLPNTSAVEVLVNVGDDEDYISFNVDLGVITMRDGVMYLQVDGVLDSLRAIGIDEEDPDAEILIDYLEEIEDEWWRISLPEIVDEFELGSFGEAMKESYVCVIDGTNNENSEEIAKLYRENQFIKVSPTKSFIDGSSYENPEPGYRFYEVSIDKNALAGYINGMQNTESAKKMQDCMNRVAKKYFNGSFDTQSEKISASDINLPEDLRLVLEISKFGHELRSVRGYYANDDVELSLGVLFKYVSAPEISAPNNYRPITELIEEIMMDISNGDVDLDFNGIEYFNLDSITMEV